MNAKQHIKDNKKVYIVGGVCLVAGILISNKAFLINYKSAGATNIFVEAPKRLGHPGNLVRDTKTGMVYASQNAAAKALNVNHGDISRHLHGIIDDVDGHVFENLGEAVA